jgi:hypothetical protein
MTQAFPLQWPHGWPRTPNHKRARARFDTSQDRAQRELIKEIQRLGGTSIVLSTNIELRRDGLPYVTQKRLQDDPGAAVYFTLKGQQKCFACDRWDILGDNIRAITKTIEALRGIERWGSSKMVEQAFQGFEALPPPSTDNEAHWLEVLGLSRGAQREHIEAAYKIKALGAHPDRGGSHEEMARINAARDQALKEVLK